MSKQGLIFGLMVVTGALLYFASQNGKVDTGLDRTEVISEFASFRSQFRKEYFSMSEMEYRLRVFEETLAMVRKHNADPSNTYTLGINQFSDMTFQELSAYYLSEDKEDSYVGNGQQAQLHKSKEPAREVDWRKANIVSKPKNQGRCGSCWAFSAVSVVEEAYALFKKVDIPNLSEQELVDCSRKYGNEGCNGGFSFQGLDYIRDHGINLDKDYPYTATDGVCKSVAGKGAFKIAKWTAVPAGPQNMIKILQERPTTASFHVQNDFFAYKSGVYNPKSCPGNRNHAVNAIGYNLDDNVPYFIVRNSWGENWGEKGYFKIAIREQNGTCWFNGDGRTTFPTLE